MNPNHFLRMAAAQINNDTTTCIILICDTITFSNFAHIHFSCPHINTRYTCQKSPEDESEVTRMHRLREVDEDISGELSAKRTSITDNFPGRGFHGLRCRSLWWSGTSSLYGRPSYLAFINNLYFTNDVLHPSAAYQGITFSYARTHVTKVCFRLAFRARMSSTSSHTDWHETKRRTLMIDAT